MKTYKQLEKDRKEYLEENSFFLLESLTDSTWINDNFDKINLELTKKDTVNRVFYIKSDYDYNHKIAPLIELFDEKYDVRVNIFVPNIFIRLLYGKNTTGLDISIYKKAL